MQRHVWSVKPRLVGLLSTTIPPHGASLFGHCCRGFQSAVRTHLDHAAPLLLLWLRLREALSLLLYRGNLLATHSCIVGA